MMSSLSLEAEEAPSAMTSSGLQPLQVTDDKTMSKHDDDEGETAPLLLFADTPLAEIKSIDDIPIVVVYIFIGFAIFAAIWLFQLFVDAVWVVFVDVVWVVLVLLSFFFVPLHIGCFLIFHHAMENNIPPHKLHAIEQRSDSILLLTASITFVIVAFVDVRKYLYNDLLNILSPLWIVKSGFALFILSRRVFGLIRQWHSKRARPSLRASRKRLVIGAVACISELITFPYALLWYVVASGAGAIVSMFWMRQYFHKRGMAAKNKTRSVVPEVALASGEEKDCNV